MSATAAWRVVAPSAAVALSALAADLAGWPIATLALLTLAAALMPVARPASTRLTLAALGGLAMGSALALTGVQLDGVWVTPLVALAMVLCGWLAARHRPGVAWRPTVDAGDGMVVLGGVALFCLLSIPYWGLSPDGVLLDLGRGIDNLAHLHMFLDVAGGTESAVRRGYPKGFHTMIFLAEGGNLQSLPRAALIPYFGMSSALVAAFSAVICGWTAVGVAGSLYRTGGRAGATRAVAGLAYGLFVCLGGLFAGMFEVGHVAFLFPAAIVVGSSWLALRTPQFSWWNTAVLVLAALAVFGSYPPLLAGLAPAGFWLLHDAVGRRGWVGVRWVILGLAAVVAASSWFIWNRWGEGIMGIGGYSGEVSTPVPSFIFYAALGLLLAWVAVRSGVHLPVSVWGSTLGYGALSGSVAALAALGGQSVLGSYYVGKLLQATWLAGSVVAVGLAAALAVGCSAPGLRSHKWADGALRGGALALLAGLLLAVPDGRYWDVKGALPTAVEQLQRRVAEAERADRELHLLAIAAAVGDDPDEVVVLADPHGWLLPFVVDGNRRALSTATLAVNLARGPIARQTGELARCMAGSEGPKLMWGCSVEVARSAPDVSVRVVVEDRLLASSLRATSESQDSIRVDLLADLLGDGSVPAPDDV